MLLMPGKVANVVRIAVAYFMECSLLFRNSSLLKEAEKIHPTMKGRRFG
jgi:hypothetical protein